jgi:MFS family permease
MLALISAGTLLNYLDRTVLGITAPRMSVELHLSPATMGVVFSAFSWSYAAAQIPGGWLLDRAESPWYRSVTLFRQPSEGDWPAVFRQMAKRLAARN